MFKLQIGQILETLLKLELSLLLTNWFHLVGYMMYRISSGDHAGQFVTANEKIR